MAKKTFAIFAFLPTFQSLSFGKASQVTPGTELGVTRRSIGVCYREFHRDSGSISRARVSTGAQGRRERSRVKTGTSLN